MRASTRHWLAEISVSHSGAKSGATGATDHAAADRGTAYHPTVAPCAVGKRKLEQRCITVAPVAPANRQVENERCTLVGATAGATDSTSWVQQAADADLEDWQAFFDERAGILEFDGGFDRTEAERRALNETIAAHGPRPVVH